MSGNAKTGSCAQHVLRRLARTTSLPVLSMSERSRSLTPPLQSRAACSPNDSPAIAVLQLQAIGKSDASGACLPGNQPAEDQSMDTSIISRRHLGNK